MEDITIDVAHTAVVLIDLQHSTVARQLAPYTGEQVVGNCAQLAQAMRDRGGMVVWVRVLVDQMLALPADAPLRPPGSPPPAPDASQLVPATQVEASDTVITKRQWGAFYGTELDQLLRRRAIRTLVLGGIATNFGVESTARAAFDRGYALLFAEDAMSSIGAEAHELATRHVFRAMGRVRSTAHLLQALRAPARA